MILLDTNVVSELMKPSPAPEVMAWVGAQPAASLYTTGITKAEILYGVGLLPAGGRRNALQAAADATFDEDFGGRVLAFGSDAALSFAQIAVDRRSAGRPISQFDAQIAAIARCFGAALATRNVTHFEGCGIQVIDPWGGAK